MEFYRSALNTPPYKNIRSQTALRRANYSPQVPILDQWGQPEVTTPTTVWVEAVHREYDALEILDPDFQYGTITYLLIPCDDCGSADC